MHLFRTAKREHGPARALPTVLIGMSLVLQGAAVTRLLCPPRSIGALAALRIGCSPRLWPFIDYPMFSEPHEPGDVLAWLDVRIGAQEGPDSPRRLYEVRRRAPDEAWDVAYAREEERLRVRLQPELAATRGAAGLRFLRKSLVLSSRGLVPEPCDGCPEPAE